MNDRQKMIATCCGPITLDIVSRACQIRLLICDVDGVLSDGLIYMGNHGEELKAFHTRDGYGICSLLDAGIEVALITGRSSQAVADRAAKLRIKHLYQGQTDKLPAFTELLHKLSLTTEQVAYIGDDLIDWPVMAQVGLSVSVADGHPLLRAQAGHITQARGGRGAVREICDLILLAQNKFADARGLSL